MCNKYIYSKYPHLYSGYPSSNTYQSIYLNNIHNVLILIYTSLVSHGLEFYFLQSARATWATRCHRVSIDRSSWIQLELPYSTAGRTYSIQIPQTTCQTTNFFLQFKFCQVVTGLFQWLLGLHSNKTPNLQCSAAFPPGSSEVCTSAYVLIFIHHCSELPISKVQELHAHPTEWHFAIAQYAVCCYYCLNVKTSHSHFHLNTTFSLLPRNTDCFLECLPESPTVPLENILEPTIHSTEFLEQEREQKNGKLLYFISRKIMHFVAASALLHIARTAMAALRR